MPQRHFMVDFPDHSSGRLRVSAKRPYSVSVSPGLLVHAVLDQVLHHARVCQGAGIAQGIGFVRRDLAQDTAHDLAGACLRQARRPLDRIG